MYKCLFTSLHFGKYNLMIQLTFEQHELWVQLYVDF